jgi:hypothetical protein
VFAARPIAFIPALLPARLSWNNRSLIAWFGPRALSSLLLVLLPVFAGLPQSEYLLTVCCLVVLFSVLLHGLSPSLLIKPPRNIETAAPSPAPALKPAQPEPISVRAADAPQCSLTGGECTIGVPAPEPRDAEYISIDEVKELQAHPGQVVTIDARSERTYNESDQAIPSAFRLPPDQAARTAAQFSIPKTAVLAVLCA